MGYILGGIYTALQQAATYAVGTVGAGGAGSAVPAAATTAIPAATLETAAGAIPAAVSVTPAVAAPAIAAAAPAVEGVSLYTKLATAAALGSAGAGLIQATKGAPDLPKPAPPPTTPTLADPRVQAAGMDSRARAAARGGMGFGNTITNTGGAQGLGSNQGLLGKTLLG